jgi:O-antigen/teichoic acid export membrane protein
MDDQQSPGLSAKVRAALQGNRDLLRNAGSLAATTGLTSVLGAGFWVIAARFGHYTKAEIGYGAAATNAMALLGTIGIFGFGTMLIGELPKRRERGGLFSAAIIAAAAGSFVLGLAFPVVATALHAKVPEMGGIGELPRLLLFAVGVMLTGASLVFDDGTIGLMRGGVQLWRNTAMSIIKVVFLPVAAVLLHDEFGVGITMSFVIGTAGSMIPAAIMLKRGGSRIWHRPDWTELRRLFSVALSHNWLNLAIVAPGRIIPVVVTLVVSPTANGVFYIAWMLIAFLFMVPVHLSTVLFAIASASPELIAEKLRFVLRVSLLIGLPVMAVLAIGAHFALGLFGPSYASAGTVPLWLLVIGYIPQMPKAQFIAVSRATNQVGRAASLLCCTAVCEIVAVIIGGKLGGLDGLTFAYVCVLIGEGLITAPTVLRAAYARTAAGSGAFPVVTSVRATGALRPATGPLARVTGELVKLTGSLTTLPGAPDRQETGLAALFALASAAVSDGHTLDVATEVWRTGSFPALPADITGPRRVQDAPTTLDMLAGQSAAGLPMPSGAPSRQLSYRHRQQAGIDALLAIATTLPAHDEPVEERQGPSRNR